MMLEVKNLKKYFGGIKAIDGCSFSVPRGKIIAIIGPNGSGKSTTFNVISHLLEKDNGKIIFDGADLGRVEDYVIARKGISRTFQHVRLFKNLTIQDHMEIALCQDDESLFKSVFNRGNSTTKKIKEILDFVGLKKPLKTYGNDLSYGQRKLLDLAMAIAKPHQLLMLDEPVAGVNPYLRAGIKKIVKGLRTKGETILLIEHDMNFVMDLADWIIVMDYGKVIAEGKPKAIQNNKKVLEAYLGD